MANQKDLYAVLGVANTATPDEIRKAYRRLARQYHPDVNRGSKQAEERFKEISFAHDVLGDAEKRRLYDEFGVEGLQPGFDAARAQAFRDWQQSGRAFRFGAGGADFEMPRGRRRGGGEDRGFADVLNEMFGGMFGGEGVAPEPPHGQDLEHTLEVDFLEALRGTKCEVTIRRPGSCETCQGLGRQGRRACTQCGGTGRVERRERLTVKVPAGVADG